MDSQFMDAGTYAWVVIIIFFLIFTALQIRNCIRNVRGVNGSFSDMYPNEAGASCGQPNRSSVYTIDVHNTNPSNYANPGYVSTEGVTKVSNDGLPTYEEAIATIKQPMVPIVTEISRPTIEIVNEDNETVASSRGGRRHRNHRRHRNRSTEQTNENTQPDTTEEHRRHRHRRGFRLKRHLAKINRRNQPETD